MQAESIFDFNLDPIVPQLGYAPYTTYSLAAFSSNLIYSYALDFDPAVGTLYIGPFTNHLEGDHAFIVTLRMSDTVQEEDFSINVTVFGADQALSFAQIWTLTSQSFSATPTLTLSSSDVYSIDLDQIVIELGQEPYSEYTLHVSTES